MRENDKAAICDLSLTYAAGECTEAEKQAFEHHLPRCSVCQKEVNDLREVWDVLAADMEWVEPPKDLKQQVLDAALAAETGNRKSRLRKPRMAAMNHWLRLGTAAIIVGLFIFGSLWNYYLFRERQAAPLPIEQALSVPAAKIERLVMLDSKSSTAEYAYGVACIVNNEQSKQFIVYVFGVQETIGDQAYQVWLKSADKQKSAGTFRVDENGVGVIAMPIASGQLVFDSISITLEPDDQGDRSREPISAEVAPIRKPFHILARFAEKLQLHLLEFPGTEGEVAGSDLIPKAFSNLPDSKRKLFAHRTLHVFKIHEDALGRFRTKIYFVRACCRYALMGFKHQVKLTDIRIIESPAVRTNDMMFPD
jgi:hypothetical protein